MTDRERWTVYPLLILALGASLRPQIFPPRSLELDSLTCRRQITAGEVTANEIVGAVIQCPGELRAENVAVGTLKGGLLQCVAMQVVNAEGEKQLMMGPLRTGGGGIDVYGSSPDQPVINIAANPDGDTGVIRTMTTDGVPQVIMLSSHLGGMVMTVARDGRRLTTLSHDDQGSGRVFTVDTNRRSHVLVGWPIGTLAPDVVVESTEGEAIEQPDEPTAPDPQPIPDDDEPASEPSEDQSP